MRGNRPSTTRTATGTHAGVRSPAVDSRYRHRPGHASNCKLPASSARTGTWHACKSQRSRHLTRHAARPRPLAPEQNYNVYTRASGGVGHCTPRPGCTQRWGKSHLDRRCQSRRARVHFATGPATWSHKKTTVKSRASSAGADSSAASKDNILMPHVPTRIRFAAAACPRFPASALAGKSHIPPNVVSPPTALVVCGTRASS